MTSIPLQKSELRKAVLAKRNALPEIDRIEMSLSACDYGLQIPEFSADNMAGGTIVSGFLPIRSEIDARPLMFALAKRGARLCVPVVTSPTTIEFRELLRGAELVPSGFGTVGPGEDAAVLDPQIMLIPLSAYDVRGGRMGYGAGYYDRAIERLVGLGQAPVLLGMAFSTQQVESVPVEPHDRQLTGVITELSYNPAKI